MRNKGRDEIMLMHDKMINDQEADLEKILGVTSAIKYEGHAFDTEVNLQNRMMKNLQQDFEKTEMKMIKLDNRLKNFIAASSPCYLTVAIIAEIILLIFLILVL